MHGFPLDHTMWRHQIKEFRATHRVIAIDLRGLERVQPPLHCRSSVWSDQLARFIDALGLPAITLCGLSMDW